MPRDSGIAQANRNAKERLYAALHTGIDLLFPPRCAGCGRVDARWCERCQDELDAVAVDVSGHRLPPLVFIASTGTHEGKLQQAVHALKYAGAPELTAPLSARLLAAVEQTHLAQRVDVIIPVPLHASRQRERGYNQSERLADYLSQILNIPCNPSALLRWRATPPQVGLNREQRQTNMRDAFRAAAPLSGSVLLIDDVFTTGATLQACAQAAREAGAAAVYGLTVSAAPLNGQRSR